MVERDYIMRILQEFFDAIAKVMRRDSPGQEPDLSQVQERLKNMYKQFFRKPADFFYESEKEDILANLKQETRSEDDLFARAQMLSELLYQDGLTKKDIPEKYMLLEKALYLLEYLDRNSRTFSWDRGQKIEDIRKQMTTYE